MAWPMFIKTFALAVFLVMLLTTVGSVPVSAQSPEPFQIDAIVLVNSQGAYYRDFVEYVQPYLDNFGIPYSVHDIATTALTAESLNRALIVIGHKGLDESGTYLDLTEQNHISSAVAAGSGLVNLDNLLYDPDYTPRYPYVQEIFELSYTSDLVASAIQLGGEAGGYPSHYITQRHDLDQVIELESGIPVPGMTAPQDAQVIATAAGAPFITLRDYGHGRAVQWSSYAFAEVGVKGYVYELDDLVWRSLVWAARKPFVMQGLPPLLPLRVDDCSGPFWWAEEAASYGLRPWMGLFLHDIDANETLQLKTLVDDGHATTAIQAFDASYGFYYRHHDSEYTDTQIAAHFAEGTQWHQDHEIPISRYVIGYFYELGRNAFDGLASWGVEFIGTQQTIGTGYGSAWQEIGPYRRYVSGSSYSGAPMSYADYVSVPGHPEHEFKFFNVITEIRDNAGYEWYPSNDVAGSIERGVVQTRRAFDSMVLATLFTHERHVQDISPANWNAILAGVLDSIATYAPLPVTMDEAARYVRAIYHSNISQGTYDPATRVLTATLTGWADVPTQFYLFTACGPEIIEQRIDVPVFAGSTEVIVEPPGTLERMQVAPAEATLTAGDSITYQATFQDVYGNLCDVTAETDFATDAAAGGIWNAHVYTSKVAGAWTVTGTYRALSDTAALTVQHRDAIELDILPTEHTAMAGHSVSYQALARDDLGNTWDVTARTGFSIDVAAGGTWSDHVYTSEAAGQWTVTGTLDGLTATATLTVEHAQATAIVLSPSETILTAGDNVSYQASAQDAYGNTWDVTDQTGFSIDLAAGGTWNNHTYTSEAAGQWTVTGTLGTLTDTATLTVEHAQATAIVLSPAETVLTAGDSVTYQASAQDAYSNTWDVTAQTAFTIDLDASGTWIGHSYTSEAAGQWTVTGTLGGLTDTVALTVEHATAIALTLAPAETILTAGDTVTYQASAQDAHSNTWDVTAQTAFTIDLDAGGLWIDNVYNSALAGTWTVTATWGGLVTLATLTVQHAGTVSIDLTPDPAIVTAGDGVAYEAVAQDPYGNVWDVTTETNFSIDAGAGGAWTGNIYSSEAVGDWTVTASYSDCTDTARLHVIADTIVSLRIAPAEATILAGDSVTYEATALDEQDNAWDVTSQTSFTIELAAGGSWASNVYTSHTAGDWTVSATFADLTTTAALGVQHAVAASISISPTAATITAGEGVTYHATARDAFNNIWDVTTETRFDGDAAAGGTWSGNVYTTERAGTWIITGTRTNLIATATLTVGHATATAFQFTPAEETVTAGQRVTYQSTAQDKFGNAWDVTTATRLSIEPGAGGTWHANAYTSQFTGRWIVTGTFGALADTGALTVQHAAAVDLEISPGEQRIVAGERITYQTTAQDALGNTWSATAESTFTIDAGAGGLWSENVYTSEVAGDWIVAALYESHTATAVLYVQPPPTQEEYFVLLPLLVRH